MLIFVKERHSSSLLGVLIKMMAFHALSLCVLKSVLQVGDTISTFKMKNLFLKRLNSFPKVIRILSVKGGV